MVVVVVLKADLHVNQRPQRKRKGYEVKMTVGMTTTPRSNNDDIGLASTIQCVIFVTVTLENGGQIKRFA